jgi:hypothetical protein
MEFNHAVTMHGIHMPLIDAARFGHTPVQALLAAVEILRWCCRLGLTLRKLGLLWTWCADRARRAKESDDFQAIMHLFSLFLKSYSKVRWSIFVLSIHKPDRVEATLFERVPAVACLLLGPIMPKFECRQIASLWVTAR